MSRSEFLKRLIAAGLLCLFAPAMAQNAAHIQPRSYRVVGDNSDVRILEFNAQPGMGVCGTGVHSHPAHVTVLLSPQRVLIHQGGKTFVKEGKAGDSFYEPPVTHEVENVGGSPARSLIIEFKRDLMR